MKKLIIVFVCVLSLGLLSTSCSNDDDKSASIEGKWQLSEQGFELNGKEQLQQATNSACATDSMEFNADGKFVDSYSEFTDNKCNAFTEEGTWSKNGNTLNKKYDSNDIDKYEILELSGSKLKLKYTYSEGETTFIAIAVLKKI